MFFSQFVRIVLFSCPIWILKVTKHPVLMAWRVRSPCCVQTSARPTATRPATRGPTESPGAPRGTGKRGGPFLWPRRKSQLSSRQGTQPGIFSFFKTLQRSTCISIFFPETFSTIHVVFTQRKVIQFHYLVVAQFPGTIGMPFNLLHKTQV